MKWKAFSIIASFSKAIHEKAKRAYPVKADEKKRAANSNSGGGSGISAFCLLQKKTWLSGGVGPTLTSVVTVYK